jgi:tetratricopeptide (TPR) repeat protein
VQSSQNINKAYIGKNYQEAFELADALIKDQKFDELDDLHKIQGYECLGNACEQLKKWDEAIDIYTKATQLFPKEKNSIKDSVIFI